jgi:hypothetical protein
LKVSRRTFGVIFKKSYRGGLAQNKNARIAVENKRGRMPNRKTQIRVIVTLGAAIFIGVLLYSSVQQTKNEYEVCVTFKGALHCATASGATSQEAIRSAQGIDCEMLANGRDENIVCLDTPPSSERQVK